jgi:C-terminal processing protease CtpA/Prc
LNKKQSVDRIALSDMVAWFATKPFKFASAFRIKDSEQAVSSNARRVALSPDDTKDISHQYAALYAAARPGDVVTFEIPEAAPRAEPRFGGKVYLLVNRNSYSNTVAVAATVQDYGFGKVVGEETSDLATTYGAMETFTLARSGLEVGFPKAYIVRPNGDQTPRGVVPDIPIRTQLWRARTIPSSDR